MKVLTEQDIYEGHTINSKCISEKALREILHELMTAANNVHPDDIKERFGVLWKKVQR